MDKNRYREFIEALRRGIADGYIKVHVSFTDGGQIGGEYLWAKPIGKKYAKIDNIPFFAHEIGMDDIVQVAPSDTMDHEYVRTISHGSYTAAILYDAEGSEKQVKARWAEIRQYFNEKGLKVEGAVAGYASVAIPKDMPMDAAQRVLSEAPHVMEHSLSMEPDPEIDIPDEFDLGLPDHFDTGEGE